MQKPDFFIEAIHQSGPIDEDRQTLVAEWVQDQEEEFLEILANSDDLVAVVEADSGGRIFFNVCWPDQIEEQVYA